MLLWNNIVFENNLTLSNIKTKIFIQVCEENKSKKVFNLFMWKGVVRPLARMATDNTYQGVIDYAETEMQKFFYMYVQWQRFFYRLFTSILKGIAVKE